MSKPDMKVLGIPVGPRKLDERVAAAMSAVNKRQQSFTFACANPHALVMAQSDSDFRAALKACTAVVADGVGLKVAAHLFGIDVGPRITGADFFLGLMEKMNRRGGRVFFFGSSDEVLSRIQLRARQDYPRLEVNGLSPPYGAWSRAENHAMVQRICEWRPDVLWVGMTAPKQEKWVHANLGELAVPIIGSIGAVFDFYANVTPRAPRWLRELGLEWAFRLVREPRRLWRRTLISAPRFFLLVMRERLSAAPDGRSGVGYG